MTISGYPNTVLGQPVRDQMYSNTGVCGQREANVVCCKLVTSTGQNGGALTFKETGQIFGIYTATIENQNYNSESMAMFVRITDSVIEWIEGLTVEPLIPLKRDLTRQEDRGNEQPKVK